MDTAESQAAAPEVGIPTAPEVEPDIDGADVIPEPVPAALPPKSAEEIRLDQILADWVSGHIFNSPVSRETPAYNHLLDALPALKAAILKGE